MDMTWENDTLTTIFTRRSVRNYQNIPIEKKQLRTVVDAGLYAASGGNHQTSEFTIIERPEILQELTVLVREEFRAMELIEGVYRNTAIRNAKNNPNYDFRHRAPALIIARANNCWPNGMADCASSLQNMQLAAASLALGSCWVNQLHWLTDNKRLRSYLAPLGILENETIYGSLALGYFNPPSPRPAPRREGRVVYID